MELKDYLGIIGKHIWLLISIVIICTIGVLWYSSRMPASYDSSSFVTVTVQNENIQKDAAYYDYDNFYSLQGSGFFADNIISWLSDPSNVSEVFSMAKIERPDVNLKKMSKVLQTKKKTPSSVQIIYNDVNKASSASIVESTIQFIKEKTESWNSKGLIKNIYIDNSPVISVVRKPDVALNTIIGFVSSLIIGLVIVFLSEYIIRKK